MNQAAFSDRSVVRLVARALNDPDAMRRVQAPSRGWTNPESTIYTAGVADDWRVRVELESEDERRRFTNLFAEGLSPQGTDHAADLEGAQLSVSGDDTNLFVYADTRAQAAHAHDVILSELAHHAIVATTSEVEQWHSDDERWDNEPTDETWEEEVSGKGYAPWEVRVTCRSRHDAVTLDAQLSAEGYNPVRQWKHLIVGTATREDADALAARLHGEVEPGGAVVWEASLDSNVVRPFAFFG